VLKYLVIALLNGFVWTLLVPWLGVALFGVSLVLFALILLGLDPTVRNRS
jgi:hypothetical protein